jgi:hypothetical protein
LAQGSQELLFSIGMVPTKAAAAGSHLAADARCGNSGAFFKLKITISHAIIAPIRQVNNGEEFILFFQPLLGLAVFTGIAWLISENRKGVKYATALTGVAIQLCIAAILLYVPFFKKFFLLLNTVVLALESATKAGTSFVFGYIGGGTPPFLLTDPGSNFILAFQALPLVLVIGALSGLLFYWRILPLVVRSFSFLLQKTMNIGGALGLGASTTIFLGMVEAPLLIKPYLRSMTRSDGPVRRFFDRGDPRPAWPYSDRILHPCCSGDHDRTHHGARDG